MVLLKSFQLTIFKWNCRNIWVCRQPPIHICILNLYDNFKTFWAIIVQEMGLRESSCFMVLNTTWFRFGYMKSVVCFRFGRTKSILWLQSLIFSFIQCVFITHPFLVSLSSQTITTWTVLRMILHLKFCFWVILVK